MRGTTAAIYFWLLTRRPTSICLYRLFSCKECSGTYFLVWLSDVAWNSPGHLSNQKPEHVTCRSRRGGARRARRSGIGTNRWRPVEKRCIFKKNPILHFRLQASDSFSFISINYFIQGRSQRSFNQVLQVKLVYHVLVELLNEYNFIQYYIMLCCFVICYES